MEKLNEVPETQTLFIVDDKNSLIGTITDGDIRRGFIKGNELSDNVQKFMSTRFHSVTSEFSVHDFKNIRQKGIQLLPVINSRGQITKVYNLNKQKSMLPVECMIMAGGRGERLRPLTDSTPKPLLKLGDKPIIEHNIDRLITYGVEKFYISVKYLGQQIVDYLGNGSGKGISIEYVWEEEPLGTAGALSLLKNIETKHVILMNSDLFTNIDFEDLYLKTLMDDAELGVATIPYTTKIPYGIFTTNGSHDVTGIKEKPVYTNYANAGIYVIKSSIINSIPKNRFFHVTHLMESLLENQQKIIHNPIIGYWVDIGQHQDYINAREIVKHIQ